MGELYPLKIRKFKLKMWHSKDSFTQMVSPILLNTKYLSKLLAQLNNYANKAEYPT